MPGDMSARVAVQQQPRATMAHPQLHSQRELAAGAQSRVTDRELAPLAGLVT